MAGVRSIRMRLGLTQTELAMMLGVSQTLVALSESGERDLPARAWQKLSLLEELLQFNEVEQEEKLAAEQEKLREALRIALETELKELQGKRKDLMYELNRMRQDHETHRHAMLVMIPEWKLFKDHVLYGKQLQKRYELLIKKFVATDETQQALLESKIRIIEVSMDELRKLLEKPQG